MLARRQQLEGRISALQRELRARGRPHAAELQQAAAALEMQRKILSAQQQFGTTWATAVISGWVPTEKVDQLRVAVDEVTGGQTVIEVERPGEEDIQAGRVPSYVVNSPFLAPFERLVRGYGVASYTELEPTVLFAVTFLLMFGLIFGDLGHGLCLLALGLLVRRRAAQGPLRDLGHVVAAAGGASMLFGAFFQGSFFGKSLAEMGFPLTLGLEPLSLEEGAADAATREVVRYLLLSLALGIALISVGAVLNVVNRLRRGDLEEGLLGRFGVTGLVFYWGALAIGVKLAVAGRSAADTWLVAGLVVVPLALVALREPLYGLLSRGRAAWSEGTVMGLMGGLIEALETVMVYSANTFSFLRVAAFALSHCALSYTIFVLLGLVGELPGGPVWSAIVFVAGTAFVIGLEGLIVGIQVVRLEYYEFFTKFFRGEGLRYDPFRLQ
jgi:V/A-type H+-transporting ATPase subunit I